jgi:hypothetical protein
MILMLLFKKDDLYSLFLSQKNDQALIKADKLSAFAAISFILIALFSISEFSAGLIYTISLLFAGEYIPDNYWVNLIILIVTGSVFYREYKKQDENEVTRNEGPRAATIFLSIIALIVGYKRLNPVYTGIAAFVSFIYLIISMGELKISSMSDILLTWVGIKTDTDPNRNYTGFSILLFVIFFIIVFAASASATTIALALVSLSMWAATWFKYREPNAAIGSLNKTLKKIIPVFFLMATIIQVIPFSYMTSGVKWIFIVLVILLSILFLVNAFQTKSDKHTTNITLSFTSSIASLFKEQFSTVPPGTYQILGATIVAFASYIGAPMLYNLINEFIQGGKVLLRDPIHLDKHQVLSTYKELNNGVEEFNYQYGISSYIYIDANNRNDYYQTILDYGGKPRVQYNGAHNSLQIIVLDDYDKEKVVLTLPDVELQKWHHLAVNYVGGNLDVFLNGELIKSVKNVVPYMTLDDLIVGSSQNEEFILNGGIKDVVYFDKPLTQTNLFFLSR